MRTDFSISLSIDLETYSSVDIKNGAYAYSSAPDFEVLLIGYKFSDEDEVRVIDCTDTESDEDHMRFFEALTDPTVLKTAYNANFERTCLKAFTGDEMDPDQWRCTMIMAVSLGLPRSLAMVGEAIGLPEEEQKLKVGKTLINYFCKPCKPTRTNGNRTRNLPRHAPEKWQLFKEYNAQDVVTEQKILEKLEALAPDPEEQELWSIDQRINDRGVKLDTQMARNIVEYNETHTEALRSEAVRLTRLDNPNSVAQLSVWLADKGYPVQTLTKADVADLLSDPKLPADVRRVLEIRQSTGKTSVKKYQTMLDIATEGSRARGIMQFYGGHTGRWAGRSLQPQNLARNTMPDDELDFCRECAASGDFETLELIEDDISDVFSQLVRTAFIPSPNRRFVVSDFSAIEARVIAWLAGEDWRLKVFREDGDIYCESASHIYHVPVEKHGVNGELRQRGKVAELALGYGGSVGAMKNMDTTGSVPEEEMAGIVRQWRAESPSIVKLWYDCEAACIAVIEGRRPSCKVRGVTFKLDHVAGFAVLRMILPNGRPISFWDPKVVEYERGPRVTYMSINQTTNKWVREETYGGKIVENIVQSIARDCLAEKMRVLDAAGYEVVFHVHDELIIDAPKDDVDAAKIIDAVMGEPIDWAPGLPLKGGTYECEFYRKD